MGNSKRLQDWWNRPVEVTVTEHCDMCKQLKPEVKTRDWNNGSYWHPKKFSLKSCKECFDNRMREEIANDKPDYSDYI